MGQGISVDRLVEDAVAFAGVDDFGDVPFLEGLGVIVRSLNVDGRVSDDGLARARDLFTGVLVKRLRLVADRSKYPEIADESITAPIFIVGPPRSGSTHMHALLGCLPVLRAPLMWEVSSPSPPPDAATFTTDPRIGQVQAMLDALPEDVLVRHPMSATRPEQCNLLNDWAFINQGWLANYDMPSYRDWILNVDHGPAYEAHRRTLQQLQWGVPGRWVLKSPKHLLALDALLVTYPDARFVWTHRDPAVFVPSVVSLAGLWRETNSVHFDPTSFGWEWALMEELALRRGLATRDSGSAPADRHYDVPYDVITRDPVGAVADVCSWAGVDFDERCEDAVRTWVGSHPKDQHGTHRYTAEEFGLDRAGLRERFRFYTERFGINS